MVTEISCTHEQAARIVSFAREREDEVEAIIVQCNAGIARSAAVALGLQLLIDGRVHTAFPDTHPNLHVLRMVLQAGTYAGAA